MFRRSFIPALTLVLLATPAILRAQRGGGRPGGGMGGNGSMMRSNGQSSGGFGGGSHFTRGSITPHSGHPQFGPPGRWWDDKKTSRSLNLRSEQQHRMDSIFESNKGQLYSAYSNLRSEEQKLSNMSPQDLKDEGKVFASIDRVAQARAELEKQNARMQLQLRQELDQDQLARLDQDADASH